MVFIVIMRNYFNFPRIMTQFVSVSKKLYLALVFSRLLGVIFPSHSRFVARMGGVVRVFYSAAKHPGRSFLTVPRYMLWQCEFTSVGPIQFLPCIWFLVCRLRGMIRLNCSVNSQSPSFSLAISISVTLPEMIRSSSRTQLCYSQ